MAQRLVRAKRKIRNAGIPYVVPPAHQLPERTVAVLGSAVPVVQRGLRGHSGADLVRLGLCAEADPSGADARRPDAGRAGGRSACWRFSSLHDARREGRTDAIGDLIPLEEQDRTQWNRPTRSTKVRRWSTERFAVVGPGRTRCKRPSPRAMPGVDRAADTDWSEIAAALRAARTARRLTGGATQPSGGGGHGRWARGRPATRRRDRGLG